MHYASAAAQQALPCSCVEGTSHPSCTQMNIANRDIKLENALLDSNSSPWPLLRLCDFGYSINETLSLAQSRVGTQVSP